MELMLHITYFTLLIKSFYIYLIFHHLLNAIFFVMVVVVGRGGEGSNQPGFNLRQFRFEYALMLYIFWIYIDVVHILNMHWCCTYFEYALMLYIFWICIDVVHILNMHWCCTYFEYALMYIFWICIDVVHILNMHWCCTYFEYALMLYISHLFCFIYKQKIHGTCCRRRHEFV